METFYKVIIAIFIIYILAFVGYNTYAAIKKIWPYDRYTRSVYPTGATKRGNPPVAMTPAEKAKRDGAVNRARSQTTNESIS